MKRFSLVGARGVWLCGALMVGVGTGATLPAWAQGAGQTQTPSAELRDARLAYETGLLLHEQGEYEVAIEVFIEAIAADPSRNEAYRALTAAQVAGAQHRLALAIDAADGGDLPAAARHARKAVALDGENEDAVTAARSVADASAVLSAAQLQRFESAHELTEDRQWRLARERFAALVDESPWFLPARAALHRAAYFEGRAVAMANEGVALMQQGRLSPAAEQLSGAVAIWPYHPDAGEQLKRAQSFVWEAEDTADRGESAYRLGMLEEALGLAELALQLDSANARARALHRDASRALAHQAAERGDASRQAGQIDIAKAHYRQALEIVPGYPDARRGMAESYAAEAGALQDADRPGAALLAYLAGAEYDPGAIRRELPEAESAVLGEVAVVYALDIPEHTPALGVTSAALLGELRKQRRPSYIRRGVADNARYSVRVRITDTDITLRRVRSTQSSYYSTGGVATGYARWEKRGGVACVVTITDRETGREVDSWDANRWVTFSDTEQYVVGSTWRRSYWTLPSDSAIASRLARDLADAVWPDVQERLTLARAQALLAESIELAEGGDDEAALEREVAATLLAGQVNEREGERALRALSRGFVGEGEGGAE